MSILDNNFIKCITKCLLCDFNAGPFANLNSEVLSLAAISGSGVARVSDRLIIAPLSKIEV